MRCQSRPLNLSSVLVVFLLLPFITSVPPQHVPTQLFIKKGQVELVSGKCSGGRSYCLGGVDDGQECASEYQSDGTTPSCPGSCADGGYIVVTVSCTGPEARCECSPQGVPSCINGIGAPGQADCLCQLPNTGTRCFTNGDCTGGGTCQAYGVCQAPNTGESCSSTLECTGAGGEVTDPNGVVDLWPGSSQACMVPPVSGNESQGAVFGGEAFGPLVVAFKDAAYKTTTAVTRQQVSVRAVGCREPDCTLEGATTVIASDGEATFTSLAITKAAPGYFLRFTVDRYCSAFSCIGGWSLTAESRPFDVLVGKFAALQILQAPPIGVQHRDLVPSPRLAATDAGGNFITEASFQVQASRGPGGFGDLLSRNDILFRTLEAGQVVFEGLFFDLPSVYDIVFNATFDNFTAAVTMDNLLVTGTEHTAVLVQESQLQSAQVAYQPLDPQPVVRLNDQFGQLVKGSTFAITAAIAPAHQEEGLQIIGTAIVPVNQGVAEFTDLAVNKAGTGISLIFSAPAGVIPASSQLFDVVPGLVASLSVSTQPHNETVAGAVMDPHPAAQQVDIGGNLVMEVASITVSLITNEVAPFQKSGSATPELFTDERGFTLDTVNGSATYEALHVQVAGSFQLKFSQLEKSVHSSTFHVMPGYPVGLYLQTEPGVGLTGFELQPFPVVAFQDTYGNFVPHVPNTPVIKAVLVSNTGNGTLLCGGRFPCVRQAVGGRTFFDGLGVNNVGEKYVLEFEAMLRQQGSDQDSPVRVRSQGFDVTGLASAAVVTAQPQDGQCEKPLPGLTSVALKDEYGNFALAARDLASVSIRSLEEQPGEPPGVKGKTQAQTVDGSVHFSDLRVDRAGRYVLTFSFGLMDARAESEPFKVSAGEPKLLRFQQLPASVAAGIRFFPRLQIIDACDNTALDYPALVDITLGSSPAHLVADRGASLASTPTAYIIAGEGILNVTVDIKGSHYQLVAQATFPEFPALASLISSSANFTVVVGVLHHLRLDQFTTSGVAQQTLSPPAHVTARDLGDNVVSEFQEVVRARRLTGSTSTSLLQGDVYVAAVNGLAVFDNLKVSEKDTAFKIEFQYQEDFNVLDVNMLRAQSQGIEVTGAVRTMRVYQSIKGAQGGDIFDVQPAIAVFDEGGIIVPSYPHMVEVSISDGIANDLQGRQAASFNNGIAYFTDLAVLTRGTRTVQFVSSNFVAQQTFQVAIGPATKLVVLAQPTDDFAYRPFANDVVVQIQDKGSNAVLDVFEVEASLRGNRQASALLGVTTRQTSSGSASFPGLQVDAVGSGFTILFEATRLGRMLSVVSGQFSMRGRLGGIAATQFPSGGMTFEKLQPPVILNAVDEAYNLCPWYETLTCRVELADSPAGALITVDSTTEVTMDAGIATFDNLKMDKIGSGYRLRFTCEGGYRIVQINSPFFTVTNPIDQFDGMRLVVMPDVSTFQVGRPLVPLPELRVYDDRGDVVSGSVNTVTVRLEAAVSEDPASGLNGTTTQTISGGMVRFTDLTPFVLGGAFRLRFTLPFFGQRNDIEVLSDSFIVREGSPDHLTIEHQPRYQGAGLPLLTGPCLLVRDVMGHVIPTFNGEVEVTAVAQSASVPHPVLTGRSITLAQKGQVIFTDLMLTQDVEGHKYSLRFTLRGYQYVNIRSVSFNSTLGAPARLELVTNPSSSTQSLAVLSQQPALQIMDLAGNLLLDPGGVDALLVPAAAAIDGEEPKLNNNARALFKDTGGARVATFDGLNIDKAGRYRLLFSCCNGLSAVSPDFFIAVGQPHQLKVAVQPSSTVMGVVISPSPQVRLADLAGNWAGSAIFAATVTLSPGSTKDAPLGGSGTLLSFHKTQQTVSSSKGMAVFSGLTIDHAGTGYQLVFHSQGLVSVSSDSFNVSGPVGKVYVEWSPLPMDADTTWVRQPRLRLTDKTDIAVTCLCSTGTIRAMARKDTADVALTGNPQATAVEGYAQFTNLGLALAGHSMRLAFEFVPYGAGDAVTGLSFAFEVSAGRPASLEVVTQMDAHWRGVPPGQQPVLGLLDRHGNRIFNMTGSVSVSIAKAQELIGTLKGTPMAPYQEGATAVFTDLAITPLVQDYDDFKLVFNSLGLTVSSAPIKIVSGPLYSIALETPVIGSVGNLNGGLLFPRVAVVALDSGGGVVYGFDGNGCNGLECRIKVRITKGPDCCDSCYTQCTNAALTGVTDLVAAKGKAEFTDLRISVIGTYNLLFQTSTFGGRQPVTVEATDLQVLKAEALQVVTQAARAATGAVFRQQPSIKITSSAGQTVLAATHSVTAQIASDSTCTGLRSESQNRSSATPSMIAYVVAVRGVATFTDLSIDSSPSAVCKLSFTLSLGNNGSSPFISTSSALFSVVASGPVLSVVTQPGAAVGNQAFDRQPALILKDQGGNVIDTDDTVTAVGLDSQGRQVPLIGQSEIPSSGGRANFTDLGARGAQASFTILFRCGNVWAKSASFDIAASSVASLSVAVQPSESSTTRRLSPAVTLIALDSDQQPPTGALSVTAELVPSSLNSCCLGCSAEMDAQGHVKFPNLTIACGARSMRLKFVASTFTVFTRPFDIHGVPASIEMHQFPSSKTIVVGTVLVDSPAVVLLDDAGLRTTTIQKNVSVSLKAILSDGTQAAMPASALRGTTMVESRQGVAIFEDISITSASKDLVLVFAIDDAHVVSELFELVHGPVAKIEVQQQPGSEQFTGLSLLPLPRVSLFDVFGNLASSSTVEISACVASASGCDNTGAVDLQSPVVLSSSGIATFTDIKLLWRHQDAISPSSVSIRFYRNDSLNVSVVSQMFHVFVSAPKMVIITQPSLSRAGEVMRTAPVIEIRDAGGYTFTEVPGGISYLEVNVSLGQKSTNTSALSRHGEACPCLVRVLKGVVTLDGLAIDTPGTFYSLHFSLPVMGIGDVISSQFSVAGLASMAFVDLEPSQTIVYGHVFQSVLSIRDANLVPAIADSVSAAVHVAEPASCPEEFPPAMHGTLAVSALDGEAHFTDLAIGRAFPCSVRVCFQLDALATGVSHLRSGEICTTEFSIRHGQPNRLLLLEPIPTLTSSEVLVPRPRVSIVDRASNLVLDFNGTITAVLHDHNHSAVALPSFVANVAAGVAYFNITVQEPGAALFLRFQSHDFHTQDVLTLWSKAFDVVPGPVTGLMIMTKPGNGVAGRLLSRPPVVAAVDKGGRVVSSFAGLVVAFKHSGQASMLSGRVEAIAENGLATFDGIVVEEPDTALVIQFQTNSSCSMNVLAPPIIITGNTSSFEQATAAGLGKGGVAFGIQPRFKAMDNRHETALLTVGFVCARLAPWATYEGSLSGTTSAAFVDGYAEFTDLAINKIGTYTLVYDLLVTAGTGSSQLCANGPLDGTINQTDFSVTMGPVASMRLDDPFSQITVTGGALFPISPVIELFDIGGNMMTDDSFTDIQVSLEYLGDKALPPSLNTSARTIFPVEDGRIVFAGLRIERAATNVRLTFEAGNALESNGAIIGFTSFPASQVPQVRTSWFNVLVGTIGQMEVIVQPGGCSLNSNRIGLACTQSPVVELRDLGGNVVSASDEEVYMWKSQGDGILKFQGASCVDDPPNCGMIPLDGLATWPGITFTCTAPQTPCEGTHRLTFKVTARTGDEFTVNSQAFILTWTPHALFLSTAPAGCTGGEVCLQQPAIVVRDESGNLLTSLRTGTVTASLHSSPSGNSDAVLSGTAKAGIKGGMAVFTDLSIDLSHEDAYKIRFTSPELSFNLDVDFTVSIGAPSTIKVTEQPGSVQAGHSFTIKAIVQDAGKNKWESALGATEPEITARLDREDTSLGSPIFSGPSCAGSTGICSARMSSNEVQFSGLRIDRAPAVYRIKLTGSPAGVDLAGYTDFFHASPGNIGELRCLAQPEDMMSGTTVRPLVVRLFDTGGNHLHGENSVQVQIEVSKGSGILNGTTVVTVNRGQATFSQVNITLLSPSTANHMHVLRFRVGSDGLVTQLSNPFVVTFPAERLRLATYPPTTIRVGEVFAPQPELASVDANHNLVTATNARFTVSVSLMDASAGTSLTGTTTAQSHRGIAAFTDLALVGAAMVHTVVFTTSFVSDTTVSWNVSAQPGAPALLQIVEGYQPGAVGGAVPAGDVLPRQPRVRLLDLGSNPVTNDLESVKATLYSWQGRNRSPQMVLGGSIDVETSGGLAVFTDLAVNVRGVYALTFWLRSHQVISSNFTVTTGAIAQIMWDSIPPNGVFDQELRTQPRVLLMDRGGNRVLGSPWIHMTVMQASGADPLKKSIIKGCVTSLGISACGTSGICKGYALPDSGVVEFSGCRIWQPPPYVPERHRLVVSSVERDDGTFDPSSNGVATLDIEPVQVLESPQFPVTLAEHNVSFTTTAPGINAHRCVSSAFVTQPSIAIKDETGSVVPTFEGSIRVELVPRSSLVGGPAPYLTGNLHANFTLGVATYTDLGFGGVGDGIVMRFVATGSSLVAPENLTTIEIEHTAIDFVPGTPRFLIVENMNTSASLQTVVAGESPSSDQAIPRLRAQDCIHNPVSVCSAGVNLSVTGVACGGDGESCISPGPLTPCVNSSRLLPRFKILKTGVWNLTFILASPAWGQIHAMTGPIEVTAGRMAYIDIVTQPSNTLMERYMMPPPALSANDLYGNRVMACAGAGVGATKIIASLISPLVDGARLKGVTEAAIQCAGGLALFTQLAVDTSGFEFTLLFSVENDLNISTQSTSFSVSGPPVGLKLLSQSRAALDSVWIGGLPTPYEIHAMVIDAGGNPSFVGNGTVHVDINELGFALLGKRAVLTKEGVAIFDNLAADKIGSPRLRFTYALPDQTLVFTSDPIQVVSGSAHQLGVTSQPGWSRNEGGSAFPWQPSLQVQDAGGNPVDHVVAVTASLAVVATPGAAASGTTVQTSQASGQVTFTNLAIDLVGTGYRLQFSAQGLQGAVSEPLDVSAGPAARLAVIRQPEIAYSGSAYEFLVHVQDAGGNFAVGNCSEVHVSLQLFPVDKNSYPPGTKFLLSPPVAAVNGVAHFPSIMMPIAGPFFKALFTCMQAGISWAPAVSKQFSVGPSQGLANCPLGLTVSATNCGPPAFRSTNLVLEHSPSAAQVARVVGQDSHVPVVQTRDNDGMPIGVPGTTVYARLSTVSMQPVAPEKIHGVVVESNGSTSVAFQHLHAEIAGDFYLTFVAGFSVGVQISSIPVHIAISGSLPTSLSFIEHLPGRVVLQSTVGTRLGLEDAYDNVANAVIAVCSVEILQMPVGATISNLEQKTFASGQVSWNDIGLSTSGVYRFKFHASGSLSDVRFNLSSAEAIVEVLPSGRPASLHILQQPGSATPRYSSINATGKDLFVLQSAPVLQLRDAAGNAVVGFRGTFEVRSSGGDATTQLGFGNKMSFHAGGSRVTLRGIFMTTQKSRDLGISLLFRSSCCSLLSQVSDDIRSSTLNLSGAATGMQMSISSSITSGEPFSIVATAVAQDGGTAYGFQGRVAITLPLASEGFVHTGAKQAQNGMARFDNLVMTRVGNFDAELTGFPIGYFTPELQSSQAVFDVVVGTGSRLRVVQQPRGSTGGSPFASQPIVQVVDKAGNYVKSTPGTISVTAVLHRAPGSAPASSNGKLLGVNPVNCNANAATCYFLDLAVDKTGRYYLSFAGSPSIVSDGVFTHEFEVQTGAVATVNAVQSPALSTGGIQFPIQPVVAVTDEGGNWIYSSTQQVEVAACCNCETVSAYACPLNGSTTTAAEQGVAAFRGLTSLTTSNNILLRFRLLPVDDDCAAVTFPLDCSDAQCCDNAPQPLDVLTGPPAILHIWRQPSGTQYGGVALDVMPVLQIQDAGRNNFTDDAGFIVTASLSTTASTQLLDSASVPALSGTTQVSTHMGSARFTDLFVSSAGFGFAITFRASRAASAEVVTVDSAPFDVLVGPAVALDFRRQPATSAAGVALLGRPQIVLVDKGGNAVTGGAPTISAWIVTDLAECASTTPHLIGDTHHRNPKAIAEISTASVAFPCASVRMRATVSTGSFITDSAVFSADVGPPIDFEVEYVTHNSAGLLWRAPVTGAAPVAFFLTYGPRSGFRAPGVQDVTIRLAGTSTETVVTGLSAHRAYFFKLCSISRYSAQDARVGDAPVAFQEQCASGGPAALVAAPIQAPEYFQVQFVGPTFVDLSWASPTVGPAPPAYRVTVTCNNITSCGTHEYGVEVRATTLASSGYGQVDAPSAAQPGGTVTFRVTNLTVAKGYNFRVVSRAAVVDSTFDEFVLYSPRGPQVTSIYPTTVPPRDSMAITCSDTPCTGTRMLVGWQAAMPPGEPPLEYRVSVSRYNITTGRVSDTYTAATAPHGGGGVKTVDISGLTRGVLIQVRLFARSPVAHNYYGPASERVYRPISPPTPPTALAVAIIRNQELRVSWQPPVDSGDGTPGGVAIARYRLEYRRPDSAQWTALPEDNKLVMSVFFLEQGLNYSFNCYAISQQAQDEGGASFTSVPASITFYYGFAPYWDAIKAPPEANPPTRYFAYINFAFSMGIKAIDSDAGQNITLSATGLETCGAILTGVSASNPASAQLVFLPKPQDSGKTFLICYTAHDTQMMSASPRCFRLTVASPAPAFSSPLGALDSVLDRLDGSPAVATDPSGDLVAGAAHVKAMVLATAGCRVEIPVVAVDATTAGISHADAKARGYTLQMGFHAAITTSGSGEKTVTNSLPPGASLSASTWDNPVTRVFAWTPVRGQDSQVYDFCITVTDSFGIVTEGGYALPFNDDYCIRVAVERCAYCMQEGESLYSVATEWRTSWLNVWSGNTHLLNPATPLARSLLRMGPTYQAMQHDSVSSIAARFAVSVEDILFWNPDIGSNISQAAGYPLVPGQPICILPNVCGV